MFRTGRQSPGTRSVDQLDIAVLGLNQTEETTENPLLDTMESNSGAQNARKQLEAEYDALLKSGGVEPDSIVEVLDAGSNDTWLVGRVRKAASLSDSEIAALIEARGDKMNFASSEPGSRPENRNVVLDQSSIRLASEEVAEWDQSGNRARRASGGSTRWLNQ